MNREHDCIVGGSDVFMYVKQQIGEKREETIDMSTCVLIV